MTKTSNEIVMFNGPSPDTPIYLRLAVQSATIRLYCRQEYPDHLSLGFDVSALAPEGYDGPFNELSFTDHSIPGQVITATGPGILDRYTITDKLPANISELEETARRYLGQIKTTCTSNEHTIYFDAVSPSH